MNGRIAISTRTRLAIALGVVVAILGILIGTAISHAATYYMTVSELQGRGSSAVGAPETVSGVLDKGTIHYEAAASLLQFSIKDSTTSGSVRPLDVSFHGAEPDDFNYGWPVIVTGTLAEDGTFQANKLLVKCPSKYQAQTKTYNATS